MQIDQKAIQKLAKILEKSGLSELEYESEGSRIRVARQLTNASATHFIPTSQTSEPLKQAPEIKSADLQNHPGLLRSPMVGTVYLSPEPGAPMFVKIGDQVTAGQTLLIIEAMKVMNPIKAAKSGKVIHIFVHDSMPVEYSEPLLVIE